MTTRSVQRKVREMYIASKVEEQYSKDEILTMYLNVVNYGDGCYGIEAASRDYFGKSAKDLTLSEAALLVGIALVSAVIVFGGNLIASILYQVVDPRIKRGGGAV